MPAEVETSEEKSSLVRRASVREKRTGFCPDVTYFPPRAKLSLSLRLASRMESSTFEPRLIASQPHRYSISRRSTAVPTYSNQSKHRALFPPRP